MSTKELGTGEYYETAPVPASKGERFKRHCARRWWAWLIGLLIFIVVLIIIIIFAIIPAVAQKTLDKTVLHVESLSILDPTPDNFSITILAHITGGGGVASHAKLDGMDVDFSLSDGKPFLTVPLPPVHGGDNIPIEKINYTAKIENPDNFLQFASTLMDRDQFDLSVNGKTKLRLGSLKMNVKYRETVAMKGLNKLQGMVITDYDISLLNAGGYNMEGKVLIPNPSVFTIQTGDVNINIAYNGSPLGTGVLPNLILTPGLENEYTFRANLDLTKLTRSMAAFLSGRAILQINAQDAQVNGVSIPWLATPLGSLEADVPVKGSLSL